MQRLTCALCFLYISFPNVLGHIQGGEYVGRREAKRHTAGLTFAVRLWRWKGRSRGDHGPFSGSRRLIVTDACSIDDGAAQGARFRPGLGCARVLHSRRRALGGGGRPYSSASAVAAARAIKRSSWVHTAFSKSLRCIITRPLLPFLPRLAWLCTSSAFCQCR